MIDDEEYNHKVIAAADKLAAMVRGLLSTIQLGQVDAYYVSKVKEAEHEYHEARTKGIPWVASSDDQEP